MTYPGGCEIGLRPIDLHLSGLRSLGVRVEDEGGRIYCDGGSMHAGEVHLDYPSVGATENVMMASVLLEGTTYIHNAAREPEIVDLQRFLNAMGADVRGAGEQTVCVRGVKRLHGVDFTPIADRIVAGTLLAAAAITGEAAPDRAASAAGLPPAANTAPSGLSNGYAGADAGASVRVGGHGRDCGERV